MVIRSTVVSVTAAALLLLAPAASATFPSCTYDAGSESVTVFLHDDEFARVFVADGGEIKVKFDPEEVDCQAATVDNTEFIHVDGSSGDDRIVISQNGDGGRFPRTIFFFVDGEAGRDQLRLVGTPARDVFRFGVDPADAGVAPAADLYGTGDARIRPTEVETAAARMLAGNDEVTGKPGGGFDGAFTLPLDVFGDQGADRVTGSPTPNALRGAAGDDVLRGLGARDVLLGGADDDRINGGGGNDLCAGGRGDDVLRACEE